MTYFFETYGCQMNQAESSSVEQLLNSRGWTAAPSADEADLVLINTCSVRITAETRALSRISRFCAQKKSRDLTVLVMG
ncbi:MAG: tRNA (N6-isopentenyl adenosine(37)-C2)-methylthiotransferase MiaB, partial [Treponema sp.]